MHRDFVTYFTWIGDELITVPDFPCWVCDVCGRREYDMRALNQLSLLLNPNAGKPAGSRTHKTPVKPNNKNPRASRP
jgi:YgiT-type zinc finger domain-containing protein